MDNSFNLFEFIGSYPTNSNEYLADKFDITMNKVAYLARKHNLHKDSKYISSLNRKKSELSYLSSTSSSNIETYKKTRAMALQKAREANYTESSSNKISKSIKSKRDAEKRRVLFGLPQQTGYRVSFHSKARRTLQSRLRKRGYIIPKYSSLVIYNSDTSRSTMMEKTAVLKYKMILQSQ